MPVSDVLSRGMPFILTLASEGACSTASIVLTLLMSATTSTDITSHIAKPNEDFCSEAPSVTLAISLSVYMVYTGFCAV